MKANIKDNPADLFRRDLSRTEVLALSSQQKQERKKHFNRLKAKKHYHNNLEKSRDCARKSAAKTRQDPEKYKKIQARKRAAGAGLTPEEIEIIRSKQNNLCAICTSPNPTDLDHCHFSGTVRWLLCKHCNRGLGAFKDSPELLRKAAQMLESIATRSS